MRRLSGATDYQYSRYNQSPSEIEKRTWTSTTEMLPTALLWLSTTAMEGIPSMFITVNASSKGLSPLFGQYDSSARAGSILDRNDNGRTDTKISQRLQIEMLDNREALAVLP